MDIHSGIGALLKFVPKPFLLLRQIVLMLEGSCCHRAMSDGAKSSWERGFLHGIHKSCADGVLACMLPCMCTTIVPSVGMNTVCVWAAHTHTHTHTHTQIGFLTPHVCSTTPTDKAELCQSLSANLYILPTLHTLLRPFMKDDCSQVYGIETALTHTAYLNSPHTHDIAVTHGFVSC